MNVVKDWISVFAVNAVIAIDAMAVLIIAIGTIEMFVTCPVIASEAKQSSGLRRTLRLWIASRFTLRNDAPAALTPSPSPAPCRRGRI